MGGRTVQKYLEFPLLVPLMAFSTPASLLSSPPMGVPMAKFDMRVWALVTCFQPLEAHIYSRLYGRRCSTEYGLSVSTLSDNYTHLTNYSVQKKQKFSSAGTGAGSDQEENDPISTSSPATSAKIDQNAARKLRGVVNLNRTGAAGEMSSQSFKKRLSEADLLVCKLKQAMNYVEIVMIANFTISLYST